jgi:antirestriction protein ArdC
MTTNAQIYEAVTARIIECLEKGVVPWRKPWGVAAPRNLSSGHVYRGINQMLLSCAAYASPYWMTLRQANELGGRVKAGERSTPIVFWKIYDHELRNGEIEKRFFLKRFFVFNAEQTQGIYIPKLQEPRSIDPLDDCEAIVQAYENGPMIEHGGDRACYIPALDRVKMPSRNAFSSSAEYYSTLFHELVHSTGADWRLKRKAMTSAGFIASHAYSYEELIAECGAAFLCAQAGIAPQTLDNSAAYIGHWIKALKNEPQWVVMASAQAAKAADLIMGRLRAEHDVEEAA